MIIIINAMIGIVGMSKCTERERLVKALVKDLPRTSPVSSPAELAVAAVS